MIRKVDSYFMVFNKLSILNKLNLKLNKLNCSKVL